MKHKIDKYVRYVNIVKGVLFTKTSTASQCETRQTLYRLSYAGSTQSICNEIYQNNLSCVCTFQKE